MKLITMSLFFLLQSSFAFTLSNSGRVRLPGPEIQLVIASNICSVAGFNSAQELADMVQASVDEYWNRIPTCALEFEVSGVDSSITTTSDTLLASLQKTTAGKILIGCSDNATLFDSSSTLGVGSINTASGDRGTFLINNKDTTFANLSSQEKLAVIAHELGHAFGLGHSGDPAALMYYSVGGKVQERLSIDDYDACSYLYPHESPGSCSAVPIIPPRKGDSSGGLTQRKKMSLYFISIFGPFLMVGLFFRGIEWRKLFLPS